MDSELIVVDSKHVFNENSDLCRNLSQREVNNCFNNNYFHNNAEQIDVSILIVDNEKTQSDFEYIL